MKYKLALIEHPFSFQIGNVLKINAIIHIVAQFFLMLSSANRAYECVVFWQPINRALHQKWSSLLECSMFISIAWNRPIDFCVNFGCIGIGTMIRTILLHPYKYFKICSLLRYVFMEKPWMQTIILIDHRILVYGIVTLLLSVMCQYKMYQLSIDRSLFSNWHFRQRHQTHSISIKHFQSVFEFD